MRRSPFILAILVAIIIATATYALYPRRSLHVHVLYHEAIGGGGVGGIIDVNLMVENTGNRVAEYVEGFIAVLGEDGGEVMHLNVSFSDLAPGDVEEARGYFIGDQFQNYRIVVTLTYSIGGKGGETQRELQINEDYMNVISSFTLKG